MTAKFYLTGGLLAPLLLVQGKYVRKVTPKLPEPEGDREGELGEGRPCSILIAGDSAAAGVGASTQQEAFSGQIANRLGKTYKVQWRMIAQSGDTSSDLIERLQKEPKATGNSVDFAIVSIGVNDVTGLGTVAQWKRNLNKLTALFCEHLGVNHVLYSCLPPMNHFPALPNPLRWWLGSRAQTLNLHLRGFCEQHPECTYVDIPFTSDPGYAATDGFHPGPLAHAIWADAVAELIFASHGTMKSTM